jgi:malate dehydrogenase (oxaloacetate-decarboxylating)
MKALKLHKRLKGKIEIKPKMKASQKNLHLIYTPGVAEVTKLIAKDPSQSFFYTSRGNNVAIISDGSRTIGVGNTIAEASLPVMEGKAVLFKTLSNIDAYPLCLGTKSAKEIVRIVEILTPNFSAFNIEDIESPKCFRIMEALEKKNILAFHDDQQGAAIVVFAGLLNALKVVKKNLKQVKICLAGAGAAGYGVFKILKEINFSNLVVLDVQGMIHRSPKQKNKYFQEIAEHTNPGNIKGGLKEAIKGADVFIGLTGKGGLLKSRDIALMAEKPIIFALSNPIPEIYPPEIEKTTKDYLYATGRSDFPNQINNALVFTRVVRGMLDKRKNITLKLQVKIAKAVADLVSRPSKKNILPKVFDQRVGKIVVKQFNRTRLR